MFGTLQALENKTTTLKLFALWQGKECLVEFTWHVVVKKTKNDMLFWIKKTFLIYIYIYINSKKHASK